MGSPNLLGNGAMKHSLHNRDSLQEVEAMPLAFM
jgi:hypothetical protein